MAAEAMRRVYEHPTEASDLGQRAKQSAEETLSDVGGGKVLCPVPWRRLITSRIRQIISLDCYQ